MKHDTLIHNNLNILGKKVTKSNNLVVLKVLTKNLHQFGASKQHYWLYIYFPV